MSLYSFLMRLPKAGSWLTNGVSNKQKLLFEAKLEKWDQGGDGKKAQVLVPPDRLPSATASPCFLWVCGLIHPRAWPRQSQRPLSSLADCEIFPCTTLKQRPIQRGRKERLQQTWERSHDAFRLTPLSFGTASWVFSVLRTQLLLEKKRKRKSSVN